MVNEKKKNIHVYIYIQNCISSKNIAQNKGEIDIFR